MHVFTYLHVRNPPSQLLIPGRPRWHPSDFAAQGNSSGKTPDSHKPSFRLLKDAASRVTATPLAGWPFCVFERQEDGQARQLLGGIGLRGSAALLERRPTLAGSGACTADRRCDIRVRVLPTGDKTFSGIIIHVERPWENQ